jgi:hypothetical protein
MPQNNTLILQYNGTGEVYQKSTEYVLTIPANTKSAAGSASSIVQVLTTL